MASRVKKDYAGNIPSTVELSQNKQIPDLEFSSYIILQGSKLKMQSFISLQGSKLEKYKFIIAKLNKIYYMNQN